MTQMRKTEGGTFVVGGGRIVTVCKTGKNESGGGGGNEQSGGLDAGGIWSRLMDGQEVEHAPPRRGEGGQAQAQDRLDE